MPLGLIHIYLEIRSPTNVQMQSDKHNCIDILELEQ